MTLQIFAKGHVFNTSTHFPRVLKFSIEFTKQLEILLLSPAEIFYQILNHLAYAQVIFGILDFLPMGNTLVVNLDSDIKYGEGANF